MVEVNFSFGTGIENGTSGEVFITISSSPTRCFLMRCVTSGHRVEGRLEIYDISGRTVYGENIAAGVVSHMINAGTALPAGVYQIRYASNGHFASTRIVVAN